MCSSGGGETLYWEEDEWINWEAYKDTCITHNKTKGAGCCKARPRHPIGRPSQSFCIFDANGRITNEAVSDAKESLCSGNYCKFFPETTKKWFNKWPLLRSFDVFITDCGSLNPCLNVGLCTHTETGLDGWELGAK